MVLYFSATGNTEYVARELAKYLNDDVMDLRERIREKDYTPIYSDRPFVICFPVYVCEPPRFLTAYLKKTDLRGNRDMYFVPTSGGYSGVCDFVAHCLSLKKKKRYMGSVGFIMPRNYIASNAYPELDKAEIERRIRRADDEIQRSADSIMSGKKLKSRHVWLWEILVTLPFNPIWYHLCQGVKDFYATDKCISCGKCRQLCPLKVIELNDGKPVWRGRSCAHCMSCIQNCPVCAIEYGNKTQKKNRYYFKKYSYVLSEKNTTVSEAAK